MSLFLEKFKQIKNDPSFGTYQDQHMYRTGITAFDYMNGNKEAVSKGTKPKVNLGIDGGKMITIVGKSGTGKSTMALQMAANIISRYPNGAMYILDFEHAHTYNRIKTVTGMTEEEIRNRVDIRQVGISTETVLELAVQIKETKLDKNIRPTLETTTENNAVTETGDPLIVLEPTVIIVDSVANMVPRDILGKEEITGQMSATQSAKVNTQLMRRLPQVIREANIIIIFINHIQDKVETSVFSTKGDLQYLKQNEHLPGGKAIQFLTNTLIKLTYGKKLSDDSRYGINGSEVIVELLKSRTAPAGTTQTLIFDPRYGFDDELTLLQILTDEGYRKGSPVSYYLEGLEEYKFRLRNFKELLAEDPEFKQKFYELANKVLEDKLVETELGHFENEKVDEIIPEEELEE